MSIWGLTGQYEANWDLMWINSAVVKGVDLAPTELTQIADIVFSACPILFETKDKFSK